MGHTKSATYDRLLADYDPTFVFKARFAIHKDPTLAATYSAVVWLFWLVAWRPAGHDEDPGQERAYWGQYYTFLAKKDRNFQCPGRYAFTARVPLGRKLQRVWWLVPLVLVVGLFALLALPSTPIRARASRRSRVSRVTHLLHRGLRIH